jgi:hypothetical protein
LVGDRAKARDALGGSRPGRAVVAHHAAENEKRDQPEAAATDRDRNRHDAGDRCGAKTLGEGRRRSQDGDRRNQRGGDEYAESSNVSESARPHAQSLGKDLGTRRIRTGPRIQLPRRYMPRVRAARPPALESLHNSDAGFREKESWWVWIAGKGPQLTLDHDSDAYVRVERLTAECPNSGTPKT